MDPSSTPSSHSMVFSPSSLASSSFFFLAFATKSVSLSSFSSLLSLSLSLYDRQAKIRELVVVFSAEIAVLYLHLTLKSQDNVLVQTLLRHLPGKSLPPSLSKKIRSSD